MATEKDETTAFSKHPPNELRQLQVSDDPIGLFLKSVEEGKCPKVDDLRRLGPEDQCLGQPWKRLVTENGVLKRKYNDVYEEEFHLVTTDCAPLTQRAS